MAGSGLPWTTIRATQFHDLIFMVVEKLAMLPLVPVLSGVAFQPVDSDEVAARLVEARSATVRPRSRHRRTARVRHSRADPRIPGSDHRHRVLLPLWLPGEAARALRARVRYATSFEVGRRHRPTLS